MGVVLLQDIIYLLLYKKMNLDVTNILILNYWTAIKNIEYTP